MLSGWNLPERAVIGGKSYEFHGDFRDILEIFGYFTDPDIPPWLSWQIALGLFFAEEIPPEHQGEAIAYLAWFINGGQAPVETGAPRLIDWEQDRNLIVADVNRAAGQEIRGLPFLHWWTFLSWFHAIGEGQLSTVVSLRSKLCQGKKLEGWELDYYRAHKKTVDLPKRYSRREWEEKKQLEELLNKGR